MNFKKYFSFIIVDLFVFIPLFIYSEEACAVNNEAVPFFIDQQYDLLRRSEITATLRETSQYAYFFIDDGWWNDLTVAKKNQILSNVHNLAVEFDGVIYPKLTEFLGNIWSPGIDGDAKITVLLLPLGGHAGGYINYSDEYPKSVIPTSNEREMLYFNTEFISSSLAKSFLAHEFQHLITFNQKDKLKGASEDIWLNEARSEYVPTYLGYDSIFEGSNLEKRVKDFLKNPSDPLCEFRNESKDYDQVNLFVQYLTDHYGKNILTEMIKDKEVGIKSINNALKNLGYNIAFSEIFTNWTVANLLNNCSIGETYCYLNPNLNQSHFKIDLSKGLIVPGGTENISIKDWQPIYYKFEAASALDGKILKIDFEKENSDDLFKVPLVAYNSDGTISISFIDTTGNKAVAYVQDFGQKINSVVVIPSKQSKFSDFSDNDPSTSFKLSASLVDKTLASEDEVLTLPYPDGSLLRAKGDYKVYLIDNGKKHWIPAAGIFNFYNFDWGNIKEVDSADLELCPRVKLLKARGYDEVYYLTESGMIRHLPSSQVFLSYDNKWEDIVEISSKELEVYPQNNLIYLAGDHKIYKLENNQKRWIKTAEAFNKLKFDWNQIAPVNLTEFDAYAEGAPIE